jgi:hypothetical protein
VRRLCEACGAPVRKGPKCLSCAAVERGKSRRATCHIDKELTLVNYRKPDYDVLGVEYVSGFVAANPCGEKFAPVEEPLKMPRHLEENPKIGDRVQFRKTKEFGRVTREVVARKNDIGPRFEVAMDSGSTRSFCVTMFDQHWRLMEAC